MAKRQIFYSFHYDNDVFRVQQIRNIGALEDNKPVSANTINGTNNIPPLFKIHSGLSKCKIVSNITFFLKN